MVTVGVTPGDSSPTDTVRKDAGYPKVPVSLEGLDVVGVYPPSSVTHPYIIGDQCSGRRYRRAPSDRSYLLEYELSTAYSSTRGRPCVLTF